MKLISRKLSSFVIKSMNLLFLKSVVMPDYNCTIHFIGVGSAYSGTKISTVIAGINDFHPTSKCFLDLN